LLRVEAAFEGKAGTVRSAREFVAGALDAWDLESFQEVACLLTSELAANAVAHAKTVYRVIAEWKFPDLRVQVVDRSPVLPPHPVPPPLNAVTGKGLLLVEALAAEWGARPVDDGKSVWFALKAEESDPHQGQ
jgi:hypothetical protein